jgi:hypothetical protein
MEFKGWELKHLLLTTQPQFITKIKASIEGSIDNEKTVNILTAKCTPITFWVGVVPIVFTPIISIDATLTLKGEIKFQATLVDINYSYTFGSSYDNGEFSPISENTSEPPKYLEDAKFTLNGELKLQPQLNYRYELYNTGSYLGLYGYFYAKLAAEYGSDSDADKKITLNCGVTLGADVKLQIFSNEIGSWNKDLYHNNWLIWEKQWGSIPEIDDLVPPEILDAIEDLGQTINWGNTPPIIEGSYFVSPLVLVKSNFWDFYSPGTVFDDEYITFSSQNNDDQTVQVSYSQGGSVGNGTGSFIVGHDNVFSVFVPVVSIDEYGLQRDLVEVYSGELVDGGIRNWQQTLLMIDDHGDPMNKYIENGQGRLFKDGDGFSERTSGSQSAPALRSKKSSFGVSIISSK